MLAVLVVPETSYWKHREFRCHNLGVFKRVQLVCNYLVKTSEFLSFQIVMMMGHS